MNLIPKKKQWKGWTTPSKLTAIGVLIGIIGIILSIIFFLYSNASNNSDFEVSDKYKGTQTDIEDSSLKFLNSKDELISIFKLRAERINRNFANNESDLLQEFNELHEKHIEALKNGDMIYAHKLLKRIYELPDDQDDFNMIGYWIRSGINPFVCDYIYYNEVYGDCLPISNLIEIDDQSWSLKPINLYEIILNTSKD